MDNITDLIIILIIAAIIIFAAVRTIKKGTKGCCSSGSYKVRRVKAKNTDVSSYRYRTRIYVDGMTCRNCSTRVENAFNRLDGFAARVSLSGKYADVRSEKELTSEQAEKIVSDSGYTFVRAESCKP